MWMSSRKGHELNRCRYAALVPAELNPSRRPSRYRRAQSQQQRQNNSTTAVVRSIVKFTNAHGHRADVLARMGAEAQVESVRMDRINVNDHNETDLLDDVRQHTDMHGESVVTLHPASGQHDLRVHDSSSAAISNPIPAYKYATTSIPSPPSSVYEDRQTLSDGQVSYYTQHHPTHHYQEPPPQPSQATLQQEQLAPQKSSSERAGQSYYYSYIKQTPLSLRQLQDEELAMAGHSSASTAQRIEGVKAEYELPDTPSSRTSVGSPVTPSFKVEPSVSSSVVNDIPATVTAVGPIYHGTTMSSPRLLQSALERTRNGVATYPPVSVSAPAPTVTVVDDAKCESALQDAWDRPTNVDQRDGNLQVAAQNTGNDKIPTTLSASSSKFPSSLTSNVTMFDGTASTISNVTASAGQICRKQVPSLSPAPILMSDSAAVVGDRCMTQQSTSTCKRLRGCDDVYAFIDSLSDDVLADVSLPDHGNFSEEFLEHLLLNREAG